MFKSCNVCNQIVDFLKKKKIDCKMKIFQIKIGIAEEEMNEFIANNQKNTDLLTGSKSFFLKF